VSIRPELAKAFKKACAANGARQIDVISGFMEVYSNTKAQKKGYSSSYATKRQRRAAVLRIIDQLGYIMANEEKSKNNIPENFHGSDFYSYAEECVLLIEEAIEALTIAYPIP
jgi:hypothetical protein